MGVGVVGKTGIEVDVGRGTGVGVRVGAAVGVGEAVAVGIGVSVGLAVGAGLGVGDGSGVEVSAGVAVEEVLVRSGKVGAGAAQPTKERETTLSISTIRGSNGLFGLCSGLLHGETAVHQ